MKHEFVYAFEENKTNELTLEYSPDGDDEIQVQLQEDGPPILFLNRSGAVALAKILLKMSLGPYTGGFHLHLHEDFVYDKPECMIVTLVEPAE